MEITELSVVELNRLFLDKKLSAVEISEAYRKNIEKKEPEINAYISENEEALNLAKALDKKMADGEELGELAGVPYGAKDNIMTSGLRTTCASKMLENFVPTYDANVISLLKKEDAILLGKNNMDEFAVGGSTETSYFGITKNPLDLLRVPGGSSGGSAAAVAAREAAFTLGTDTGGSIRQPASFCGVVGIKPTYGAVSRYGVQSMSHSLDQVGTLARDVRDAFYALRAIAKKDERDGQSRHLDCEEDFKKPIAEYLERAGKKMRGVRIAKPKEFFSKGITKEVREKIENAILKLEKSGAVIEEVELKHLEYTLPAYYAIAQSELSSNLARFDGVRLGYRTDSYETMADMMKKTRAEGFGDEVKRRILLGTYCTRGGFEKSYYRKALKARTLLIRDFKKVFEKYDYIIAPTVPTLPFVLGERTNDPIEMYLSDVYTVPVNLAGICAVSVPVGKVGELSVGCQLMADRFKDYTLFDAAMALEGAI